MSALVYLMSVVLSVPCGPGQCGCKANGDQTYFCDGTTSQNCFDLSELICDGNYVVTREVFVAACIDGLPEDKCATASQLCWRRIRCKMVDVGGPTGPLRICAKEITLESASSINIVTVECQ